MKENGISVNFTEGPSGASPGFRRDPGLKEKPWPTDYIGLDGERLDSKPEELTHLYGKQLVEKSNPVIAFRGKLDTLCAMLVEAQVLGGGLGDRGFVDDMEEILDFVRAILPAEIRKTPLGEFHLLGLSSRDLRERSHHPQRYFGRPHLLMSHSMGPLCVRLNTLRVATRETELAAVAAFCDAEDPSGCRRKDIIEAFNRLSSLFYILVYKYLPANYVQTGDSGI